MPIMSRIVIGDHALSAIPAFPVLSAFSALFSLDSDTAGDLSFSVDAPLNYAAHLARDD
jgi:hypothetical protein